MKKYIIGGIIGAALTFSVQAAADSWIGKEVQGTFPVYVNGQQLETPAVVIDGSSFLPVRTISNAVKYDVNFDEQKRVVNLNNDPMYSKNKKIEELRAKADQLTIDMEEPYKIYRMYNVMEITNPSGIDQDAYAKAKKEWEDKKTELKAINDEIAALQAQQ